MTLCRLQPDGHMPPVIVPTDRTRLLPGDFAIGSEGPQVTVLESDDEGRVR